jgi:hypothetical protein
MKMVSINMSTWTPLCCLCRVAVTPGLATLCAFKLAWPDSQDDAPSCAALCMPHDGHLKPVLHVLVCACIMLEPALHVLCAPPCPAL